MWCSCADCRVQCLLFAALAGRPLELLLPHQKSNGHCLGAKRRAATRKSKKSPCLLPNGPVSTSYALGAAGPRRVLLAAWLVVLGGVVRLAHLQRNQLSLLPGVLAGKASPGKVKVRGARRPFAWQGSTLGLTGDLQPLFEDLVLPQGHQSVAGLPDLTGKNLDCLVTAPRSMSLSRFHFLSRLLFQEMGWTKEASSAVTTYSASTVLPSVGDALCLSASDRVWPWEAGLARLLTRQWVPVRGGSECRCGTLALQRESGVVVRECAVRVVLRAMDSGKTLSSWAVLPRTSGCTRACFFLHIIRLCCSACMCFVAVVCRGFLHFF